jgi:hypothetical protein
VWETFYDEETASRKCLRFEEEKSCYELNESKMARAIQRREEDDDPEDSSPSQRANARAPPHLVGVLERALKLDREREMPPKPPMEGEEAPPTKKVRTETGEDVFVKAAELLSDPATVNKYKLRMVMQKYYGTVHNPRVTKELVGMLLGTQRHLHRSIQEALQDAFDALSTGERTALEDAVQEAHTRNGAEPDGSVLLPNGQRWFDLVERLTQSYLRAEATLYKKGTFRSFRDPAHGSDMDTLWHFWVKETQGSTPSAGAPPRREARVRPTFHQEHGGVTCYRCGEDGHTQRTCKESNAVTCTRCSKTGHLAKACNRR